MNHTTSTESPFQLSLFVRLLQPVKQKVLLLAMFSIVVAAVESTIPLLAKFAIDDVIGDAKFGDRRVYYLVALCVLQILLTITSQAMEVVRKAEVASVDGRISASIRTKIVMRLLNRPTFQTLAEPTGQQITLISRDVDALKGLIEKGVLSPFASILKILGILTFIFFFNWQVGCAVTVIVLALLYFVVLFGKKLQPLQSEIGEDWRKLLGHTAEVLSGIRVVKLYNTRRKELFRFTKDVNTIVRKTRGLAVQGAIVDSIWSGMLPLAGIGIVGVGGYLTIRGDLTFGDLLALQIYLAFLIGPVSHLFWCLGETQGAVAKSDKVLKFLGDEPEKSPPLKEAANKTIKSIDSFEFRNVFYRHEENHKVEDISFELCRGQSIAIVGASGSGKSTIVDLACRFLDPERGEVLVNGLSTRSYSLEDYLSRISVVNQDAFLFQGTVAENIRYGLKGSDAIAAAHDARVTPSVEIDKRISVSGFELSGGEKQRVSIARGILKDPDLLVLDEATSQIDSRTEKTIVDRLFARFANRMILIISHRFETIERCDSVIVLDRGRIVEVGAPRDLWTKQGAMYRLFSQQGSHGFLDDQSKGSE